MHFVQQHHDRYAIALERCKSFTFDVNQQAESLIKWEQRYNQHSSGRFSGYLDELKLGGIHLFEEFTNQTLLQQCCVKENSLWIGFSLQAQRPKINNNKIAAGQLMMRPSGVDFELMTPQDFHIFGLVLDGKSLQDEMVEFDAERWQSQKNKILVSEPNHYMIYELAKLIQLLLGNNHYAAFQNRPSDESNRSRLNKLMPLILSRIADLLAQIESGVKELQVQPQTKQKVISAVSRYIKQTNRYPLTITELCKITHVSRRALHYCFEQGLGVSPIQYIRDCRLNEIRRILLRDETEVIISDLALDFGFFHISTFNAHYKQLFEETPTQTIQRSANYKNAIISYPKAGTDARS
ncbi:transcriptional regulator, AraC family [Psychromonas ingrahamii 37]|uniref:Transcriptional regulator, AraC family n=1 Tax=Psychromonas ingrahamii (strain DSM 17664 / CCUG 51855 / 37) TaxID=357804 RepID=A1SRM6_PSYIN|nr:helix-turn-helix domain-containing protein [Psychromonas ingrahamii]ABM02141.1 transcriptional regulator, AraC family [Psychromonas ingrahamii 37]